ncbi:type II secretion system protein GspD [Cupriavidus neocaledonicus]|uniref:Type II secretory pathway, component PulD n=1 Tax=Cupriavidus neocaledonicus TaxID=1040979 RepID=A0ABY1UYU7_9BURK
MRRLFTLILLVAGAVNAAELPPPIPASLSGTTVPAAKSPARFDFQFVQVAQVLQVIYGEAIKTPYVLAPDVLTDQRTVSFRYDASSGDLRAFLGAFLDTLGMQAQSRGGVDFVTMKPKPDELRADEEKEVTVYRPKYRNVSYLSTLLRPIFPRGLTLNRSVTAPEGAKVMSNPPPGSAAAMVDQDSDTLVFAGTAKEVTMLNKLLPQLDVPGGEVAVRAVAYEVATTKEQGSAFQLALNLLGGKLSLGLGPAGVLPNAVRFTNNTIDAVFSALSDDSRFKVINSPNLRIRSGETGRLNVGQKVPVLGAVSYPQGAGQAVQSVEYQASGVIFELRPTVREGSIDITVTQQISDFVKTTTGVNNSPTLNTREVTSSVTMQDGEMILLGGLKMRKDTITSSGMSFLPRFLDTTSHQESESEILLVLQLNRI